MPERMGGETMKLFVSCLMVLIIASSTAVADTYIRHKVQTDGYYYGGTVTEPEEREYEVWIGDERVSYKHDRRMIIIDQKNEILTFVNLQDSSYAETALPIVWEDLLEEEAVGRALQFRTEGTIKDTGKTKMIDGRECKCYEINSWIPYEGTKYNERDTRMWVSTDMPFDMDTFIKTNLHYLQLQRYNDAFLAELSSIKGYEVASESKRYIKGFAVSESDEIVEINDQEAPTDAYTAPEGFTKKDKLSIQDL
jgi:hypothetical protein